LTAILFYMILVIFFSIAFNPAGVSFTSYSYSLVSISDITEINGIQLDNPEYNKLIKLSKEEFNEIRAGERDYVITKEVLMGQKENDGLVILYDDAPAINYGIGNIIQEVNGVKIKSREGLEEELMKYSPEDKVILKSKKEEQVLEQEIVLGENPLEKGKPWLGIFMIGENSRGVMGKILSFIASYKKQSVHYETNSESYIFIKDFLWWIAIINFMVALFNMLPLGILDGGRFFYLTILGITKNDKIAKKSFALITAFIFILFIIMMLKWIASFIW